MKRDPRLHALSSEHHHALVLARRATRAAEGRDPDPAEMLAEVRRRFEVELAPHFDVEEQLLLPALAALGERELTALVERTLEEHRRLRDLVAADARPEAIAERLGDFAALLTAHVRFEERVLFPAAEAHLPAAVLDRIAAATAHDG